MVEMACSSWWTRAKVRCRRRAMCCKRRWPRNCRRSMVVLNKIDRPDAPPRVLSLIEMLRSFSLTLDATEDQLDFPVVSHQRKNFGVGAPSKSVSDSTRIFSRSVRTNCSRRYLPPKAVGDPSAVLQIQVTNLRDYSEFLFGRVAISSRFSRNSSAAPKVANFENSTAQSYSRLKSLNFLLLRDSNAYEADGCRGRHCRDCGLSRAFKIGESITDLARTTAAARTVPRLTSRTLTRWSSPSIRLHLWAGKAST